MSGSESDFPVPETLEDAMRLFAHPGASASDRWEMLDEACEWIKKKGPKDANVVSLLRPFLLQLDPSDAEPTGKNLMEGTRPHVPCIFWGLASLDKEGLKEEIQSMKEKAKAEGRSYLIEFPRDVLTLSENRMRLELIHQSIKNEIDRLDFEEEDDEEEDSEMSDPDLAELRRGGRQGQSGVPAAAAGAASSAAAAGHAVSEPTETESESVSSSEEDESRHSVAELYLKRVKSEVTRREKNGDWWGYKMIFLEPPFDEDEDARAPLHFLLTEMPKGMGAPPAEYYGAGVTRESVLAKHHLLIPEIHFHKVESVLKNLIVSFEKEPPYGQTHKSNRLWLTALFPLADRIDFKTKQGKGWQWPELVALLLFAEREDDLVWLSDTEVHIEDEFVGFFDKVSNGWRELFTFEERQEGGSRGLFWRPPMGREGGYLEVLKEMVREFEDSVQSVLYEHYDDLEGGRPRFHIFTEPEEEEDDDDDGDEDEWEEEGEEEAVNAQ
uniref:Uncharacterized protein n=1 Tax=Chromera velia CCMP2878 TaxID=1169474 RepID=A0A0G4IBG3_9ALVE|eukprot:Cvel_12864.t1-p1 / transcript=Cvel_12864.t1 / gene=Cvel_12864 / organism=Chromera_velia_CCMP2878 / gene_product=hypothetical protein / transcript_product=hypothetical protein / location=Cvel_scaffold858:50291-51775(+) / protein_length=495 / sequence_SO=supercontig / SO=protein_coding / is_pseudo=false